MIEYDDLNENDERLDLELELSCGATPLYFAAAFAQNLSSMRVLLTAIRPYRSWYKQKWLVGATRRIRVQAHLPGPFEGDPDSGADFTNCCVHLELARHDFLVHMV